MSDVEIDKLALELAITQISMGMGNYIAYSNDLWGQENGVGNPIGRTGLRVMLENAIGEAIMEVKAQQQASLGINDRLQSIRDSFEELDVSLGSGWDDDYVTNFS